MEIQKRIVVERNVSRGTGLIQPEILAPRVRPPGIEGGRVELRSVPTVVEPQTEARAAQSERPDFCVLAVTTLRCLLPLVRQVLRDSRVRPFKGVFAVPNHVERLVPSIVRRDHGPQT